MPHRFSLARIRTADELAELLAIPLYYILLEKAEPTFPQSFTARPSPDVIIKWTSNKVPETEKARLPIYVHWKQWREVAVPILEDATYSSTNPLWRTRQGGLVGVLREEVRTRAVALGYGAPDQDC